MEDLKPREVVAELDKYVIGQAAAKRAMAVALRNRFRRRQLPEEIGREILPKNIMMIGPTGVGKTEIARRVARLIDAPFVKVEATKFTEVGYVGRDVDSIVNDLIENSVTMVHEEKLKGVHEKAEELANERIIDYLCQQSEPRQRKTGRPRAAQARQTGAGGGGSSVADLGTGSGATASAGAGSATAKEESTGSVPARSTGRRPSALQRQKFSDLLSQEKIEDQVIEIEISTEPLYDSLLEFVPGMSQEEMTDSFNDYMQSYNSYPQKRQRKVPVKEARRLLTREEANKLIDFDQVVEEAIQRAEETAVVFIDELDKIAGPKIETGADVSGEGVQRDLLPIVEGSTVQTRFGPVRTDHVLFIAAGAFYAHKPSDLIPELQGRFPLRVELASLTQSDFERILTEPSNALTKQYTALLSTEGVELVFASDGTARIAEIAFQVNERAENIGARRLHTVMERVLEEISFEASDHPGEKVTVDAAYVDHRLGDLLKNEDLSKYIL